MFGFRKSQKVTRTGTTLAGLDLQAEDYNDMLDREDERAVRNARKAASTCAGCRYEAFCSQNDIFDSLDIAHDCMLGHAELAHEQAHTDSTIEIVVTVRANARCQHCSHICGVTADCDGDCGPGHLPENY